MAVRRLRIRSQARGGTRTRDDRSCPARARYRHGDARQCSRDEFAHQVATVRATGKPTAAIYVVVEDVEGHAERARAAGAEITIEPTKQDYGGSNYTCRDFEGNLWSFGSYNPWTD
jgi:uncharacterized glyoxalase superfamily protein PhnB